MPTLFTWGGRSIFNYLGSVRDGTTIIYGQEHKISVTNQQYVALLNKFRGRTVPAGISRTDPPPNNVGEWLQNNVTPTAMSSYVCAILINEGYAERVENTRLRFS
jgi:hypothetical protein